MRPAWMLKSRALARQAIKGLATPPPPDPLRRAFMLNKSAATETEATLYIYGDIGQDPCTGEGYTALDVEAAIQDAKKQGATSLAVRIISGGGDVFEGNGIHEALKRAGMKTTAFNDSLCASAATVVALGCDKVIVAPTSKWMVHHAWTYAMGDARDLRETADLLDMLDGTINGIYSQKTGKPIEDCLGLMNAGTDGTWMTAEQTVAYGFGDEVGRTDEDSEPMPEDKIERAVARLMAQTEARLAPAARARLAAQNRAVVDAAKARLAKNSGASPGSTKPAGQPGAAPKK